MERGPIAQSMRPLFGGGYALDDELHPMPAARIDDEQFAIEVQKRVEALISRYHTIIVSYIDN
jgi:hypothetical protein